MGRERRPQLEGALYHVGTRGNNRRPIYTCDEDRELFLRLLAKTVDRYGWRLHLYCLMGNHYHLLLTTPDPNLALGMKYLNNLYARLFNQLYGRKNHLFGARYFHELVERESYLTWLTRYIPRNPVRSGFTRSAGEWRWSSFNATVGHAPRPVFLDDELVLRWFVRYGGVRGSAPVRYRRYVDGV